MDSSKAANSSVCSPEKVVLYLEGELSPAAELEVEQHVAGCRACLDELNSQKQLLRALEFAFEDKEEIELPPDFARVVATRAESDVTGLRSPKERRRALFLCLSLFLVVAVGLGAETERIFRAFASFAGNVAVIGGFVFHLVGDVCIGIWVILRSLGHQFVSASVLPVIFIIALFIFSAYVLSRLLRESRSN